MGYSNLCYYNDISLIPTHPFFGYSFIILRPTLQLFQWDIPAKNFVFEIKFFSSVFYYYFHLKMQYILSMNLQGETKVQWSKLYTISFVSPCIIFLPSWKVDFGQVIRPICIFQITSTVFHPIRFLNTNTTKLPSSILFLFLFRFLKKVIPKSTQLIFKSKFSPSLSLTTKKKNHACNT